MNCCNSFGHCSQGADCPVRMQNARIIERLSHEITAQLDADLQACTPLATANSDGSDPFFSPAISVMPGWLEKLRRWCQVPGALANRLVRRPLGRLAGYFTGR